MPHAYHIFHGKAYPKQERIYEALNGGVLLLNLTDVVFFETCFKHYFRQVVAPCFNEPFFLLEVMDLLYL